MPASILIGNSLFLKFNKNPPGMFVPGGFLLDFLEIFQIFFLVEVEGVGIILVAVFLDLT